MTAATEPPARGLPGAGRALYGLPGEAVRGAMVRGPGRVPLADRMAELSLVAAAEGWTRLAACQEADPDLFFPVPGEPTGPAKRICAACPVRAECLDYALRTERGMGKDKRAGIYGGLTREERWLLDRSARRLSGQKAAA